MALNSLPANFTVLEQANFLERAFQKPLEARLAYAPMAERYFFPNGIGETITKTRPGLFPLAAAQSPINPLGNTGLDNGLSDTFFPSEQYQIAISEYALTTSVNIKQDRTLLERVFTQNYIQLAESAARTFDSLCAQYVHQAYDSGNTFCTAANSSATQHVDNIKGFDTAFSSTNSPGLPSAVSSQNPLTVSIYNTAGTFVETATVIGAVADSTNTSTANVNGVAYGISGTITFSSTPGVSTAAGYWIVANDGSFKVMCSATAGAHNTRYQLTTGDIITLQYLAQARSKLAARGIPPFPNGYYACVIDPRLWPLLLKDSAFNYATMGQMGEGYFKNGIVNRTLGIEFVESQMVPAFTTNTAGVSALHAVVFGQGSLIKGTFQGHVDAARQARDMDGSDLRFIDANDITLVTRDPIDRLREWVTQTWNWVGGFVAPTDVTSTPLIYPTTDYSRFKRCVVIESSSQ